MFAGCGDCRLLGRAGELPASFSQPAPSPPPLPAPALAGGVRGALQGQWASSAPALCLGSLSSSPGQPAHFQMRAQTGNGHTWESPKGKWRKARKLEKPPPLSTGTDLTHTPRFTPDATLGSFAVGSEGSNQQNGWEQGWRLRRAGWNGNRPPSG